MTDRKENGSAGARRRVLVTATPPTPNGDLHLGHLSGPYLRADIHTRYRRMRGDEAYYISGVDDNQSYVALKGEQIGLSSAATALQFGDRMAKTLEEARIEVDHVGRPDRSPHHVALVQELVKTLYERGKIVAREAPHLHCETCDRYVFEAFVSGRCPHCSSPSGGNACEDCGRPNDCVDLVEPRCKRCGNQPVVRHARRLYLPLSQLHRELEARLEEIEMGSHLRTLCDKMLADGLPDISISHLSDWGIPVPIPGFEGQTIYVWFEMAPGYLAATREMAEARGLSGGWESFWRSDDAEIVQFFGFDNGYFHAVLFPVILLAWDEGIRLPRAFAVNEFYRLDGLKFSTSRRHAIWGEEMLARLPADPVRFYLSYSGPENEQTNFSLDGFRATVRRELIDGWEPWLRALGEKIQAECGGCAPAGGIRTAGQSELWEQLHRLADGASAAYGVPGFSAQRAARLCCELVREARRFAAAEEHWTGVPARWAERRAGLALELLAAKTLALLSAPLMPDFAARLWRGLGFAGPVTGPVWEGEPQWVPAGQRIADLTPGFPDFESALAGLARG